MEENPEKKREQTTGADAGAFAERSSEGENSLGAEKNPGAGEGSAAGKSVDRTSKRSVGRRAVRPRTSVLAKGAGVTSAAGTAGTAGKAGRGKVTKEKAELSPGVIERISMYLNCLVQFRERGYKYVSSKDIGMCTNVNPAEVRRDLIRFGSLGRKGMGYPVDDLIANLRKILGARQKRLIALVGAGNLGTAIINYDGLKRHGFHVALVFDNDPAKIGKVVGGIKVLPPQDMVSEIKRNGIRIGIIATPGEAAQEVANELARAGVRVIVNYSDSLITAPPGVTVHNSNPVAELLHTLYFLSNSKG